ncbi:hypothetical protein D9757_011458 [Collybiopsis confluens]|uniref:F-box domain-containing protein n=1 Tax=Collybiopsis confluens TaxID=2823264 RepID=A0A8H5LR35_9AGAR|nr:hypothetical protein D9757_011458 [Collybiopsis confluens]
MKGDFGHCVDTDKRLKSSHEFNILFHALSRAFTMPFSILDLPTELHEQIIDYAVYSTPKSTKDILAFALVCRIWTPRSRHHLSLSLDETTVKFKQLRTLNELCQHPLSTLIYIGTLQVSNTGSTRLRSKQNLLDHSAVDTLFSRQFMSKDRKGLRVLESAFVQLKELGLERVGWWTLKGAARNSLIHGFRSVTKLDLSFVSFDDFGHFHELVCSFPLLETLHANLQHRFPALAEHSRSVTKKPGFQLPPNLHSVQVASLDKAALGAVAALTPCPSLRHFHWRSYEFYHLEETEFCIIGDFIASAGSSLVNLSLTFDVDSLSNDIKVRKPSFDVAVGQFRHFQDSVDLSENLSLQNLTLDIRPDPYLVLFLHHSLPYLSALSIHSLSIPFLEDVIFALKNHILWEVPTDKMTEKDLILGLQHPALQNVQKLEFSTRGWFSRDTAVDRIGEILSEFLEERGVSLETYPPKFSTEFVPSY